MTSFTAIIVPSTRLVEPPSFSSKDALKTSAILSDYGAGTRYPGDLPELSRHDATNAATLAAGVRMLVERALLDPTESTSNFARYMAHFSESFNAWIAGFSHN